MRWSAFAILAVLGVVTAATAVGALLPREHTASRFAEFHGDQRTIWTVLTDFAAMDAWMPGVNRVTAVGEPDGPPRWTMLTSEGELTFEVIEAAEPHRLVTRIVDTGHSFGGTWTYEITPVTGATRLTITEDGWVSNPLYRFLTRYLFGTRTMDGALRGLGDHLGETVLPRAG